MGSEMRAVFYLGPEKIEMRSMPIPVPADGELLVRVQAATTCGTDVKTFRRGHSKFPPPFVFGHEFGGEIVEIGAGVTNFKKGMRVTANVFAECGECFFCKRGQGNLCTNLIYNFGAFAEYNIIPASIVRKTTFEIPSHISSAQAAVVEPLVTVVHGQNLLNIQPGEVAAIIGAGGAVGLMHQQLALRAGADKVIAVGHSPLRLAAAQKLGAAAIINSNLDDPVEAVQDLTRGYGADVVIECAGTKKAWQSAVDMCRRGGRVMWFGGLPAGSEITLDAASIHYGELKLIGTHGGTAKDARQAFDLITSGVLDTQALLTAELPLENVEQALRMMIAGDAIKMVINPALN